MDDIALFFSDLTTPDRADRAREAWEAYRRVHGGELQDLIADLAHLADVDEVPGGGAYALRRGAAHYVAELPTAWLSTTRRFTGAYLAQTRPAGGAWITVGDGDNLRAVAERLVGDMQRVGFRMADMPGHIEGLTAGYVLASEEGYEFRVIANPECRA